MQQSILKSKRNCFMPVQNKDIDRLADIIKFSRLVLERQMTVDWDTFEKDDMIKWAFVKWMENIGEAAYQLSDDVTTEFNELEWRNIINARHFYVHHYFDLKWQTVWKTITNT